MLADASHGFAATVSGMTFEHLPSGWADRPLTNPDIFADAVDLFASDASRYAGCLYLLLCDARVQLIQSVAIDQWDFDATAAEQRRCLQTLLGHLADLGIRDLVAVLARRGRAAPIGNDHQTASVLRDVCEGHGIRLDGLAIATPTGVLAHRAAAFPLHAEAA